MHVEHCRKLLGVLVRHKSCVDTLTSAVIFLCKFRSNNLVHKQFKEELKRWITIAIIISAKCKSMKMLLCLRE
jgi:hypothetical protein